MLIQAHSKIVVGLLSIKLQNWSTDQHLITDILLITDKQFIEVVFHSARVYDLEK